MKRASIVVLVSVLLGGCRAAGPVGSNPLPKIAEPDKAAEVIVIRAGSLSSLHNAYGITLDGNEIFRLRPGDYTRFKVAHGAHRLGVRCYHGLIPALIPQSAKIEANLEPQTKAYYLIKMTFDCAEFQVKAPEEGEALTAKSAYRPFE